VSRPERIVFEGILIIKSPHLGIACGILYVHQIAKYKIEKVLEGNLPLQEIVIDHPACDGDVFNI
jgi:hypothetical protein